MIPGIFAAQMRQGAPGGIDPHWSNVVFLSHFDGTDGATSFVDQKGHTFTVSGSSALSTSGSKFGTASLKGAGGYFTTPKVSDFDGFGPSDAWTHEGFWYIPSGLSGGGKGLFLITPVAGGLNGGAHFEIYGGNLYFYLYRQGETNVYYAIVSYTSNAWQYFKITNTGSGDPVLYINGSSATLIPLDGSGRGTSANGMTLQVMGGNINAFQENIDELRITKGVARTETYAVPTEAFPNS